MRTEGVFAHGVAFFSLYMCGAREKMVSLVMYIIWSDLCLI